VSSECAAVLVVFDVLMFKGRELLAQPLAERRRQLESVLLDLHPCLQLVEQTASIELARDWMANLAALEGVVAKRDDERYRPGYRGWLKVKRQRTVDCVVVGFAGDERRPALVLALRNAAGQLRTFGVTRAMPESQSEPILELLNHSGAVQPAIRSRWQHDQVPSWRPVTAEAVRGPVHQPRPRALVEISGDLPPLAAGSFSSRMRYGAANAALKGIAAALLGSKTNDPKP
jgi:ATP-dependent DNA ligase